MSLVHPNVILALGVCSVFLCFEFVERIPVFVARKGTHLLSGLLLLQIEYTAWIRLFCVCFAVFVVHQTWFPQRPWRFARPGDLGITFYGSIVAVWALFALPMKVLAPLFFADPLGAIVGKSIESPRWYLNKTVAGSAAVFVAALVTTYFLPSIGLRIALSVTVVIAEALGGSCDNMAVACPLLTFYLLFGST
uniref:Dolichol kinase n=1 Tax=Chromera velia CCMP2878 TaxID=1169474 RepID=A0A0G4IF74_9ALVE|eukprot:Cvel_13940.t1-p1 / transcript=Cvel_13940.t1 / gene=Cvel_13940 / organism=Chromera_velia_CCMP2878 / gene_product=hypothetical protein / transcript_product=hypothetical protein / location=Cvel_scaffold973:32591-33835(-) / protein_length=192 / sequence_SO=supercontig / SO=protein_coding / is_pseudo=false